MKTKKIIRVILLTVLFIGIVNSILYAGSRTVGTDAFLFMRLGLDASGMALGGARVASVQDASGVVWNPAGLAGVARHQILFSNSRIFNDKSANMFSYAGRMFNKGVIGFSLLYVDLGNIDVAQIDVNTASIIQGLGTSSSKDVLGMVSYGYNIWENLYIGANIKIAKETLADESAAGFAVDGGFQYSMPNNWRIGMVIQNVGTQVRFITADENLPMVVKGGVSKRWFNDMILTEIDLQKPSSNTIGFNIGTEIKPFEFFALRFGWDSLIDAGSGLSVGFGTFFNGFELSYTYIDADELDNQQRLTLGYKWGGKGNNTVRHKRKLKKYDNIYKQGMDAFIDKRYSDAIEKLTIVKEKYKNNVTYNKILGLSYFQINETSRAKQHLKKVIELDPEQNTIRNIIRYLQ